MINIDKYAGKNPYVDNLEWWTSNSRLIGIHLWIYRIRKIDVVNENFLAEIRLSLTWEGTKKDFNEFEDFQKKDNIDQELFKHTSGYNYILNIYNWFVYIIYI